jgi:hypothetical protein
MPPVFQILQRGIRVEREPHELRLPPPGEFLWQNGWSTSLANPIAGLDENRRDSLKRDATIDRR